MAPKTKMAQKPGVQTGCIGIPVQDPKTGRGAGVFEVHPTRRSIVDARPTSAGYVPQQPRL